MPIYFLRSTAVTGHGGTDYRLLTVNAETAMVESTIADFGTDTAKGYIVLDPFTTRATRSSAPTSSTAATGFGWAIQRSDMNVGSGKRALNDAENFSFQFHIKSNVAQTGGSDSTNIHLVFYRIRADNTTENLGVVSFGSYTLGITYSTRVELSTAPFTIFDTDEALGIEFYLEAPGKAVTGFQINFAIGPVDVIQNINHTLLSLPIFTIYTRAFSVSAIGTATKGRLTAFKNLLVTGLGIPTLGRRSVFRTLTITMIGTVTVTKKLFSSILATAVGTASLIRKVGITKLVTMVGIASVGKFLRLTKDATMVGVAVLGRAALLFRNHQVTMVGQAIMNRALIVVRGFAVTAVGAVSMFVKLPQAVLNRMTGGGTVVTTIRRFFTIED